MFAQTSDTPGFTLIELLVVIAIISVLTAVLLPNFVGIRGRADDARLKNDLGQMKTALRLYYNDFQVYPDDNSGSGVMHGCGENGDEACSAGGEFSVDGTIYMKALPESFYYEQTLSGDGFFAYTVLDNEADEEIAESATRCGISSPVTDAYYVCNN